MYLNLTAFFSDGCPFSNATSHNAVVAKTGEAEHSFVNYTKHLAFVI